MKKHLLAITILICLSRIAISQYAPSGFGLGTVATRLSTNYDLQWLV